MTTKTEQEFLLKSARAAILNYPKIITPDLNKLSNTLKEKKGVFVTLTINDHLRGCIGSILPVMPLYEAVIQNAVNAAYSDPRFPPLTKQEASELTIEVSILTDPVRLAYIDAPHLLKKLNDGEGIIIKKEMLTATFLPQVWEQLPDKEQFLMNLCLKAHLSVGAWKDNNMEVYAYKVEKFGN
ncbi:MAG: AmmeMemoRadiSam system protein A [Flavobacteriales bacterium]|jgi:AmmeMemoRadiSam system protein A|nr:AmmeMemoRadiSam system protein A [Flavobacteriales bacterium]|tara:strand:+ start:121 stop:669 length:549 start_codon:yes stop_codon:yes gene_type:complete